jgi:hypothetical protein
VSDLTVMCRGNRSRSGRPVLVLLFDRGDRGRRARAVSTGPPEQNGVTAGAPVGNRVPAVTDQFRAIDGFLSGDGTKVLDPPATGAEKGDTEEGRRR